MTGAAVASLEAVESRPEAELHYGLPPVQDFIRDAWYVVAFSRELAEGATLSRRCCNDPIVLFRLRTGEAAALYDRCPHRGVPLAQGVVIDDAIQCAYHGFRFGKTGRCVAIPSQDFIAPQMQVRSFPLIERAGFIWVWPGKAENADPALLPDHQELGLEGHGWSVTPYVMVEIKANYAMLFENLLDTSHISFLHGGAIDTGGAASSTFKAIFEDRTARLVRTMRGVTPNASMSMQYGLQAGRMVDREIASVARMPNVHQIVNTFTFPDEPQRPPHVRINVMPITPATPNSLYQFLTMVSSYEEPNHAAVSDAMRAVLVEDKVALEAIQRLYDEFGFGLQECSVRADVAALRGRRMLHRMAHEGSRA